MFESLFNKVAGLKTCNSIKKRHQRTCFPVKLAKFLRTLILKNICERLLLLLGNHAFVTQNKWGDVYCVLIVA